MSMRDPGLAALAEGAGGGAQADARAATNAVAAALTAKGVRRPRRELRRFGAGNFKHNLEFQQ
jgi:hypothetical protein